MRYRTRGRPSKVRQSKDLGTKELQEKRKNGQTQEPLDRYYAQGLIGEQQYWAGNHFRWLYTMRYGVPSVKAIDLAGGDWGGAGEADEAWLATLNAQYIDAQNLLSQHGLLDVARDALIYQQGAYSGLPRAGLPCRLSIVLDLLVDLWC